MEQEHQNKLKQPSMEQNPDSKDNYPLMDLIINRTFLYEGWNLISIPFIQPDTNLGIVLDSIKDHEDLYRSHMKFYISSFAGYKN
jgi:hypothetical protein